MIHLLQLWKLTNFDLNFLGLLSDLKGQAEDLGYDGCEEELVESILFDNWGLEMMDSRQLQRVTEYLLKTPHLDGLEHVKGMIGG